MGGTILGFIARRRERDAVLEYLDAARAGRFRSMFIEGEAGIGKSRLIDEAVRSAAERGVAVFRGGADVFAVDRPYHPLIEAFGCSLDASDPSRRQIARLLADPSDAPRSGPIAELFLRIVESAAVGSPVMLVVEDLHWADDETLACLGAFEDRLTYLPVFVVGSSRAVRPDLEATLLRSLGPSVARLPLAPLEPDDVASFVEASVGARAGEGLIEAVAGAAGNPFYLGELLAALEAEGQIAVADGVADVHAMSLPSDLRLTILRTIAFLPAPTVEILRIAAILGGAFSVGDLSAALGRRTVDLLPELMPAVRARVLIEDGHDRMRFRHDLIRSSIYEDLPMPVRQACHRDVARALATADAPAVVVAEHMWMAASPGDEEAIEWLERAGSQLVDVSVGAAISLLERALELAGPVHPQRASLIAWLIGPLCDAGRGDEARSLFDAALALDPDPEDEARLRLAAASWVREGGDVEWGREQIARLLQIVDDLPPDHQEAVFHMAAEVEGHARNLDDAFHWNGLAMEIGERIHPDGDLVQELLQRAALLSLHAVRDLAEAGTVIDRAVRLAREMRRAGRRGPHDLANALWRRGLNHDAADAPREAVASFREARALYEELGDITMSTRVSESMVYALAKVGAWDEVIAEVEADLHATEGKSGVSVGTGALALFAHVSLRRGDVARARDAIDRALAQRPKVGPYWVEALIIGADDPARGAAGLEALIDEGRLPASGTLVQMGVDAAVLARAAGSMRVVHALAEFERAGADRLGTDAAIGFARFHEGIAEGSMDALRDARDRFEASGFVIARASACRELGALVAASDPEAGRALFDEAEKVYEAAGARAEITAMHAQMRAVDLRPRTKRARRRPKTGWGALTDAERAVAVIAAEGLTNPQIGERLFISRRTVQTHLSNVFRKLGIGSRVELASIVAREGDEAP